MAGQEEREYLLRLCFNSSSRFEKSQATNQITTSDPDSDPDERATQYDALMYIIVVLAFYSFGMVLMIIKYLKVERRDLEEEKVLEDYFKYKPSLSAHHRERSTSGGRLALSALNAANIISQPFSEEGRITFVWMSSPIKYNHPSCSDNKHVELRHNFMVFECVYSKKTYKVSTE